MFRIFGRNMKKRGKRGVALEQLTWWLIALAVLAIILIFAYLLKDKLVGMVEYIKNIFSGR